MSSWRDGPVGSSRPCTGTGRGPSTGWSALRAARQGCSPTGACFMAAAEQWEPYDARVSCTVLRERGGAIPPRHSPRGDRTLQGDARAVRAPQDPGLPGRSGAGTEPGEDAYRPDRGRVQLPRVRNSQVPRRETSDHAREGQGSGAFALDQGVSGCEQTGSRWQGSTGSGACYPGLDRLLPARLLSQDIPLCRLSDVADALVLGTP